MLGYGHDLLAGASTDREGQRPPAREDLVERRSSLEPRRRRPRARIVAEILIVGGLMGFAWFERGTIERSVTFAQRADWKWLVAAGSLQLVSLMGFARTQRIILREAGVRVPIASMAATTLAGNAISVSLPLVGPGAGTAFTFGRFRRAGGDAASAGWTLMIAGLISSLLWGSMLATGAAVSGNRAAKVGGLVGGAAILIAAIAVALSVRRLRARQVTAGWVLRLVQLCMRMTGRMAGDQSELINGGFERLMSIRMSPGAWIQAVGLSMVNWLASVGCLVIAILAVGASVPWTKLLLIYCAGAAVGSFNLTPGGLGVVEGTLAAGLVAAGMRSAAALGSVLIFRLVSFWLVMLVGWTIYALLVRASRHGSRCFSQAPTCHPIDITGDAYLMNTLTAGASRDCRPTGRRPGRRRD